MIHAQKVAALLQLVRQANSEEVELLLEVAQWLREHREALATPPKPAEVLGHGMALLAAARR
ncbi:MAG: hypothetical protein ABSA52_21750 [Candidatus Binatia bacterium]|jgi:predicted nucleic acid-binding Zn ribbon protein